MKPLKYKYRPSCMKRRMLCPISARLEHDKPDVVTEYAQEGTLLHEAVATGKCPESFTAEQTELFEYCNSIKIQHSDNVKQVFVEKKLRLYDDSFNELIDGTPDLVINIDSENGIIDDWKFGRNEVEDAVDNIQLACYAAMAMQAYGLKNITCNVIQPRIKKYSTYTFSNERALTKTIKDIITKCESDIEEYAPESEYKSACQYCKALSECPARKNYFVENIEGAEAVITEEKKLHAIESMSPRELSDFYLTYKDKLKLMNKFMDSIEDRIKQECQTTGNCGQLEIKITKGNRKIEDMNQLVKLTEDMITPEELLTVCSVKLTDLENLCAKNMMDNMKAQGMKVTLKTLKEEIQERLKPAISYQESKVSIVAPVIDVNKQLN